MKPQHKTGWSIGILLSATVAIVAYKIVVLDYTLVSIIPHPRYDVRLMMELDGHDREVSIRTFLPPTDARQRVENEHGVAPGFRIETDFHGHNRVLHLSRERTPNAVAVEYHYSIVARAIRFDLDPGLPVPEAYPSSAIPHLLPTPDVQVDDPEIRATLAELGASEGALRARLEKIYAFTAGLRQRPFKGTTDALTALRLGEASCNGKSRLFIALARAAGIPARLVGGLVLKTGRKRTSHQWVEAWAAGHWVPFDPTNRHFAELPANYLELYLGDESLLTYTRDINLNYAYVISKALVPSSEAKTVLGSFNVWALFERLGLSFTMLQTLLMLPVGALVVVLFRNVVGLPTYGTFLPALLATAAGQTGLAWGLVGLAVVVLGASCVRWLFGRLELLHSPTLAILLAAVAVSMLGTTMAAERFGLMSLTRISLFPIAVLAISAERFYLSLAEQGWRDAAEHLLGTAIVIAGCYLVISSLALQVLVIGFPEVLLVVVALDIYLGRWVGLRLWEYLRFRGLWFRRTAGQ